MTQADWKPQEPGEAPQSLLPDAELPRGEWPAAKPDGWPGPWPPDASNPFLAAALEYAEWGWRVHPLVPRAKHPLLQDWPSLATTDPATIFAWWQRWPDANVGLVTGYESAGLSIVDVDPRNGGMETLERLRGVFADQRLPRTHMVHTGSGGYHLYFDALQWFAQKRKFPALGPGVDLPLNVVAPPSIHPSGEPYVWIAHADTLAGYPVRWLDEPSVPGNGARPKQQKITGTDDIAKARRALAGLNPARADNRDDWLHVGMALHGVSPDLLSIWQAWTAECHTHPPASTACGRTPDACAAVWQSFTDKQEAGLGLGSLLAWVDEDSLRVRSFDTIQPEKITWLWPGVVPYGKLTLFIGDAGYGKSYITLDLAARLSAGTQLPDGTKLPKAVKSLLVFCEDGAGDTVRPRLDRAGANVKLVDKLDVFGDRGTDRLLQLDRDLGRLEALIVRHGYKLVVLDPVSAYLGTKVNSWKDDDIRALLGPVATMADRTKVAIVGIMHLNKKQTANVLQRATGAGAFTAVARSVIVIGPHTEDSDKPRQEQRRVFAPEKANLGPEGEARVFRVTDTGIAWEGTTQVTAKDMIMVDMGLPRQADKRMKARELLNAELASGPRPATYLYELGKAQGISADTMRAAKDDLGVVVKQTLPEGASRTVWTWRLPDGDLPF